jgi:DNA-binding response OmpR family regulator
MVVDDEQSLSTLFKDFLSTEGYDVVAFTNPLLALDHFKNNSNGYSLIITDLRMPGLNGIDFANKVRELNDHVKIFLTTAFDIQDLIDKPGYANSNIEKVIQKPIRLRQLREIIHQTMQISTK